MKYNTGNYQKYMTKNPLKRRMVDCLNYKIINYIERLCTEVDKEKVKILDAGCGEGFISDLVYKNVENVQIIGLEYMEEALKIAREMNKNINYVQGDIYDIPFEENAFDIVLCTEVLEHLQNPNLALQELMRVAKYAVVLSVPNEPWFCMGNLLALKNVRRFGNPIDHINHWTYRGFVNFFMKQNICDKDKCYPDRSFPWTIMICRK